MDAPEIVVGLDIGTTKIACLVGRKTRSWENRNFRGWKGS